MTIEAAKNLVVPLFLESDVISLREIYAKTLLKEAGEHDDEIFALAMEDLEERGLIKKLKKSDPAAWVLNNSLISLNQTITIDGECAIRIADTINSIIREFSFDKMAESNPYCITQADLEKLLLFLSEIKKQ